MYPADASFCPRCGRANDHQQVQALAAPPIPVRRRRSGRGLRLVIGLVIVMLVSRGLFRSRTTYVPPSPVAPSVEPGDPIDSDVTAALWSLESFSQARQSWAGSHSEKKRFAEQVRGRRVSWFGRLQSSWRPGAFDLLSGDPTSGASIRMMPATTQVKEQARQIPPNTTVEVEGVLMDDQWLHLLKVRVVE